MDNERKPSGYWTKEKCHEVALLCESRSELVKKYRGAYKTAIKEEFLEEICSHMTRRQKPSGYWNKEKCFEIAINCKTRTEFKDLSHTAYNASIRNGWLDEICSHMVEYQYKHVYWTKEKCYEKALECSTIKEFRLKYNGGYDAILKFEITQEAFSHMLDSRKLPGYWSKEKCEKISRKCSTRKEFQQVSPGAFVYASKHKIIKEICSHMKPVGNYVRRWVYSATFPDGSIYFGLTYDYIKRWNAHKHSGSVYNYSFDTNTNPKFELVVPYLLPVEDAQEFESFLIDEYRLHNYNVLNKVTGGAIGVGILKWTFQRCKEEADKYNHKVDFKNNSSAAYSASINHGWFNELCLHMTKKKKSH